MNDGTKKAHERDDKDERDSDGDNVGERDGFDDRWWLRLDMKLASLFFVIECDSDGNDVGYSDGLNEEYLDGDDEGGKFLVGYNYCHF